jgi:hypothetical protein
MYLSNNLRSEAFENSVQDSYRIEEAELIINVSKSISFMAAKKVQD